MKWLAGILFVVTLSVWGAVIWTFAGIKSNDYEMALKHTSIGSEMMEKVRVNNYFKFVQLPQPFEEEIDETAKGQTNDEKDQSNGRALEQYIGQVDPDESVSIDTLLIELGIQTVVSR
ncbi:hypothetical protein [Gracilibacillus xinjiangensis]|uniref:Uncharacterized protein n=1 Tax=Gracilibacillus xinjiangensis TaxID=1193282 RepID=A0ABV8WW07_9BACI